MGTELTKEIRKQGETKPGEAHQGGTARIKGKQKAQDPCENRHKTTG